jgi:hypothetical protein
MGFDLVPRSPLNAVHMPAKANRGRSSLSANQTTDTGNAVDQLIDIRPAHQLAALLHQSLATSPS